MFREDLLAIAYGFMSGGTEASARHVACTRAYSIRAKNHGDRSAGIIRIRSSTDCLCEQWSIVHESCRLNTAVAEATCTETQDGDEVESLGTVSVVYYFVYVHTGKYLTEPLCVW